MFKNLDRTEMGLLIFLAGVLVSLIALTVVMTGYYAQISGWHDVGAFVSSIHPELTLGLLVLSVACVVVSFVFFIVAMVRER